MRFSLIVGDVLQLLMIALAISVAVFYDPAMLPIEGNLLLAFNIIVFLVSGGILWYFTHCISHHFVGWLTGIKFKYYFITTSGIKNLPGMKKIGQFLYTIGIKIDHEKSKKSRLGYTLMFSAGAVASMTTPFIPAIIAWFKGFTLEATILFVVWALNFVFTAITSPIAGDFMKARKAWKKYS